MDYVNFTIPSNYFLHEWVNKIQTFEDQFNQGRRPRIKWDSLYLQINSFCEKIYEGTFENIFYE